jgi:hypothetical protein
VVSSFIRSSEGFSHIPALVVKDYLNKKNTEVQEFRSSGVQEFRRNNRINSAVKWLGVMNN